MDIIDVKQGTDEWRKLRAGKVTASRIADLTATTKSGWAASRNNYMIEIVTERMTDAPYERGFVSKEMQWGTEQEPHARALYELMHGVVHEVGFCLHPVIKQSGCSPDGIVDPDGIVQFKCPNTYTHWETVKTRKIDGKYMKQVQWEMACTQRLWCDFVSYDPRIKMPKLQMVTIRVPRDDAMILWLEADVSVFLREVENELALAETLAA